MPATRPFRFWRDHPVARPVWRVLIAVVGLVLVVVGLVLVPAPGPGWAIVFAGIAVWSREFEWAHRLERRLLDWLRVATSRVPRRPTRTQAVLGTVSMLVIAGGVGYALWLTGAPTWLPDVVESPLQGLLGGSGR